MTCKDCIHYDVCRDFQGSWIVIEHINKNEAEQKCEHFKDKSLIIELPCKIGDIVWAKGVFTENIYSYKVDNVGLCHAVYHNPKGLNNEIDFKEDNIGKTVFLTKEEAETKLKELNGNG